MSELRKIRRMMASLNEPKKFRTRLKPLDILLIIGLTLLIPGIIVGVFNYLYYTGGRPEHIFNWHTGTEYVPAEPPGDPARKANTIIGAIVAGAGLFLSASALIAKLVFKNSRQKLNT
ncbi:MAG: hypothetical protein ABSB25_03020 [Sedimentisphaerales bacterium]|jgi:hypothetical protein